MVKEIEKVQGHKGVMGESNFPDDKTKRFTYLRMELRIRINPICMDCV